jgi:hypothetical protein
VRDFIDQSEIGAPDIGGSQVTAFAREGELRGISDVLKIIRYVATGADAPSRFPDEPNCRPADGKRELLGWALTASILLAGSSYWMGIQSLRRESASNSPTNIAPKVPAWLPPPRAVQRSFFDVSHERSSSSEVAEPVPVVIVSTSKPKEASPRRDQVKDAEPVTANEAAIGQKPEIPAERTAAPTGIWPAQTIEGASGRLVRIGHFATESDAKKGWETVLRQYPGMQNLNSLPVPIKSLRDGHLYYRLQVGTTSHAHSDVVCQRVRDMDQSCSVIGSDDGSEESAT